MKFINMKKKFTLTFKKFIFQHKKKLKNICVHDKRD